MTQFDETQFYICGEKSNMINYKGNVYTRLMPIEQIVHMSEQDCKNCETFGSWNGCIVMYCGNCDSNGCGAKHQGQELNTEHLLSANSTYLKDVDWTTIGDITLEDSYKINFLPVENQFKENKDYPEYRDTFVATTKFAHDYYSYKKRVSFDKKEEQKLFSKFKSAAEYKEYWKYAGEEEVEEEVFLTEKEKEKEIKEEQECIESCKYIPEFQQTSYTFWERLQKCLFDYNQEQLEHQEQLEQQEQEKEEEE